MYDMFHGHIAINVVIIIMWIAGIIVARGFWSTFFAIIFPFWAVIVTLSYLVEKFIVDRKQEKK